MSAKKNVIAEALLEIVAQAKGQKSPVSLGLMAQGSELGTEELLDGAVAALAANPGLQIYAIGPKNSHYSQLKWIETGVCENDIVAAMEKALDEKIIQGAVALHYPFPIGVTTIGRIVSPAKAKAMFIASCTGASSSSRVASMVLNAIYGIATAKASGIDQPSVGLLNLDGAGSALRVLQRLQGAGYPIHFGTSGRGDGGNLLRGNDIVSAAVDVLVCDTLTGNTLMKVFSTYTSGGFYESAGFGYGPSVGEKWDKVVSIISRSSGAPVIANALGLTATLVRNNLSCLVEKELALAKKAGLDSLLDEIMAQQKSSANAASVTKPASEPVDAEISGVDVLDMDRAAEELWRNGLYAETAMGCTGPVVRVAAKNLSKATDILKAASFI